MSFVKKNLPFLFILLFLTDLGYSFYIHYHTPLAGDLAETVYPFSGKGSDVVLNHPFGFKEGRYQAPGRFFAVWTTKQYFENVPILLQHFVSPIESLYIASALIKTFIQLCFVFILSYLISRTTKILSINFSISLILIMPFFQSAGYNRYMGIIDQSIVYTFFYALPLLFLLLTWVLVIRKNQYSNSLLKKLTWYFLSFILLFYLSFHGPLAPAILLLISTLFLFQALQKAYHKEKLLFRYREIRSAFRDFDKQHLFLCMACFILSGYSLYLSSYDSLSEAHLVPLLERFEKLPYGLFRMLSGKIGYPILLLSVFINLFLIKKISSSGSSKVVQWYKWVGVFSVSYLFLLPVGGYRIYRENIIRYDTAMPITIMLIFLFGLSSYHLINNLPKSFIKPYILGLSIVLMVFTYADQLKSDKSFCEKKLLAELSLAEKDRHVLPCDCTLVEWNTFTEYEQSEINANFFYQMGITKQRTLYKQACN